MQEFTYVPDSFRIQDIDAIKVITQYPPMIQVLSEEDYMAGKIIYSNILNLANFY